MRLALCHAASPAFLPAIRQRTTRTIVVVLGIRRTCRDSPFHVPWHTSTIVCAFPEPSLVRPAIRPNPCSRREIVRAGLFGAGATGLSLADVLASRASRAAANEPTRETSVILLYLHGGPSHLETYDLKPAAPIEYRSLFRPIATNVAGLDVCEHLPRHAAIADNFALIRSLHHKMSSHSDGGIEVLTGKTPVRPDPASLSVGEHPDLGAVASRMKGVHPDAVPRYVALPQKPYMTRPAYLGLQHGPFVVGDPSAPGFKPPSLTLAGGLDAGGLNQRRGLLQQFDRLRADLDLHGSLAGADKFQELALQMLASPKTAEAFDLSQEDETLRDRYGRHLWGQSCLLARRLAEAGTAVVTVFFDSPKNAPEFSNWDDHYLNNGRPGHFGQYLERRLPYLDQALATLIGDLHDRGRDQDIMVVVLGEFGRTPRIATNPNGAGRDHWPDAQSALVSGGGLRTGQVIGATNSKGEYPTQRPLGPQDLLATVYRHLGIDHRAALVDYAGRPTPILFDGEPIAELI